MYFLFLLLFNFGLTSVFTDHLPVISITVKLNDKEILHTDIAQNCCAIEYTEAFKVMAYLPKRVKKKIRCYKAHNLNDVILSVDLQPDGAGYSVTIPKATAHMADNWRCTFYSSSTITTRKFKVHVRGKRPGILYINNNNISIYPTEFTILDYDRIAYHHYIDGEMTSFKCEGYNWNSPKIMYQNKFTNEQMEVVDFKQAVLYLRLTKEYDKSYLDCKVTEKDGIITNTIRVFFYMDTALNIPKFMINEMVLTPVSPSSPEYNTINPTGTFVYEYYDHENVIIRTLTGNFSSLRCYIDNLLLQTIDHIKLNVTLYEHHNNLKLTCTMKDNKRHNDVFMTLKLKYVQSSDFYPISGLSWANVLAKYGKDNEYMVIQYVYGGNRLLLTCYGLDNHIRWEFHKIQIISEDFLQGQIEDSSKFFVTNYFEMKPTYNKCTIKCYEENQRGATEVELIRGRPQQFANISEKDIWEYFNYIGNNEVESSVAPSTHARPDIENKPDSGESSAVVSTSTPYDGMPSPTEDKYEESFFKKNSKVLLICITVIVAITVIAITVHLIMKRLEQKRKEQADSTNINYENIPEHNDGPMPIPPQWKCNDDNITYSTPDVGNRIENLYAKPLPKDLRSTKKTPIYAEAFDYSNRSGADYVNTGSFIRKTGKARKVDSHYSEVYQNGKEVNFNDELKYANISQLNETCAEEEPKTLQGCDNTGILKEHCYGNLNATENQASNNYSEPAYAEIK